MSEHISAGANTYTNGSRRASPAEAPPPDGEPVVEEQTRRFGAWTERHPTARWFIIGVMLLITLPPGIILLAFPSVSDRLEGFSLAGVFLVNFLANVPVVPIPGLSPLGQAVILRQAAASSTPWLVGIAGGLGMGLGETPVYYTGIAGERAAHGTRVPGPAWFRRWVLWAGRLIQHLMRRWGMPTIFVLSAIPNPIFEVAGLTAGTTRLGFRRYVVAAVAGKIVRGLILVYLAGYIPFV
ncbi:MAG: VTT domain-containing protein [Gemmatimonadaceae bacterium]